MRNCIRKILAAIVAVITSISSYAVVASPKPFEYTKPDGTKVMARMYGDEFHSYITTLDGELLEGSREPEVIEQAAKMRRARRIEQAAGNSAFPTTGSPRSLVLLVSFSDLAFGETLQNFQDLLTKPGYNHNGATGSCRDYYIASSDSIFQPQFDCYGPFTLSRETKYYGANKGEDHNVHAADMVAEACQMAHESGVNFKDYDTNNDGILDNVFIFFAGHNEAEQAGEKYIWPHASNISYMNIRLDGVLVSSYACTSEYKHSTGSTRCGIGTFCHEFGHVIGQPDFYDTDYNFYTVGDWDIMCQGSYNNEGNTPPTFSAYERMYEGWLAPKQLELPGRYTLSATSFHHEAYLIAAETHNLSGKSPNPNEFFLIENRNGDANIWDSALPGHGMLVWHIDYSATAWTSNTPNNGPTLLRMHLEEANGINWKKRSNKESGRSSDPYPGTNNVKQFNPILHNGTQLPLPIFNIEENSNVISFTFINEGGSTLRTDKEQIELTTTLSDQNEIENWEAQSFELLGTGLDPNKDINLRASSNFMLYAGGAAPALNSPDWKSNVSVKPQLDSTIQQSIWVKFHPRKRNCEATQGTISISASTASMAVSVKGYAPRHTYVKSPSENTLNSITPYSFTVQWENQKDAEYYYFTLYQILEGTSTYTQSFEDFNDYSKIQEQGWQSNTTLTTTSAKADGVRALYIKKHGDQIISETYPVPVTSLSFWYNAFTSDVDTIGVLEIEAYNGEEWIQVENRTITDNSIRETAKYNFEDSNNYRSFRLTWLDNGGAGIAFDAFTATTSKQISYIHKGREIALTAFMYGDSVSYTCSDLEPGNTYYYQVQCTDLDKGCEEHLTDLSEPVKVTTLEGEPIDGKKLTFIYDSISYSPATHAIYVANPQDGDYLYFYKADGQLVSSIPVKSGVCGYPININYFTRGEIYIVQHAVSGKLKRKNKWVKFVY